MKEIKTGNQIEIKTDDKVYTGIKIDSPEKNALMIKLNSGYNMGIDKKKIKSIKVLKKTKTTEKKEKITIKPKKNLKTVSILHTGGTIASKVDYETGAVSSKYTPEDILKMFPELKEIVNINSRLIRNMASDDMRFAHYNILAKEIEKEIEKGVDGIIITHGTDTLHYSSAALSFALEDLPIPIILVGSQRSSDRGSSDAALNLISACYFISKTDFAEVAICMHENMDSIKCTILPGTKARKMHSSKRSAFKAINDFPWATVNMKNNKIEFMKSGYKKTNKKQKLKLKLFNEKLKIGMIKSHPQMFVSELEPYDNFDGLILEGTGLGHFPISEIDEFTKEHKKIFNKLKNLSKKIPLVISTQTIYGRVNLNVYSPGRILKDKCNIIGNLSDMTPETSFIKLAWILSNYPKDIKKLMIQNLRGELTSRSIK